MESWFEKTKQKTVLFCKRPGSVFVIFLLSFLWQEMILRVELGCSFLGIGFWYILLFSFPAGLFVWTLLSFLPPRAGKIAARSLMIALFLLYGSQFVYYRIFSTYYTLFSVLNGGQVWGFFGVILVSILKALPALILLSLPAVLFFRLSKDMVFPSFSVERSVLLAAVAIASHMMCMALLLLGGKAQFSPYDLYFKSVAINYSVENLGVVTTMRLDAQRLITGFEEKIDVSASKEDLAANDVTAEPKKEPETDQTKPPEPAESGPNVMDIDFDRLIGESKDETLTDMHRYFRDLEPTMKNEKTGMFEGCNLITFVAEGFSSYVIDPELTPTLYKMYTDGFQFSNFYTPLWGVSTLDGEYVTCQSLVPKPQVWSMYKSADNLLPFTLGNEFLKLNYQTFAYHDHTYTYYHRDSSHPNMGYVYKGVGNGLEMENVWPRSDKQMIDITTGDYLTSGKPFHVYYLSVSGHLLYTFTGNTMASRNRDLVRDLNYSDHVKAYLACQIELDRALELLLSRLEEAGVADKTVIALSADHYPYGLTVEEIGELAGHPVDQDFELYKNTFLLYKKGMTPETVDKPCSSLDVLPTLLNLFGVKYDSRLLAGRDIFSDTPGLVMFSDRSYITDLASYSTRTKALTPLTDAPLPEGYKSRVSAAVNNRFSYSAKILDYDYYRVLFGS